MYGVAFKGDRKFSEGGYEAAFGLRVLFCDPHRKEPVSSVITYPHTYYPYTYYYLNNHYAGLIGWPGDILDILDIMRNVISIFLGLFVFILLSDLCAHLLRRDDWSPVVMLGRAPVLGTYYLFGGSCNFMYTEEVVKKDLEPKN